MTIKELKRFDKTLRIYGKLPDIVAAVDGLGGAAAFKNRFRRKIGSSDGMRFKKLNRKKRYSGYIGNCLGIDLKCIHKALVYGVLPVLQPEDIECNTFEVRNVKIIP